jgi:hypothetical protein
MKHRGRRERLIGVAGLAILLAWGCGTDEVPGGVAPGDGSQGMGTLVVELRAAPAVGRGAVTPERAAVTTALGVASAMGSAGMLGSSHWRDSLDVSALHLTFSSLRVYPVWECDGPHDGEDSTFIEVLTDPVTVDVMDLDSTLAVVLGEADLPVGDYSHLAIDVSEAWAVTDEGLEVPVTLPGAASLKVLSRFTVADGEVTGIAIVIDLERSIREVPPGSGNLVLRPVLWGEGIGHHGDGPGDHHGGGPGDGEGYHHGHGRE